jgi:hypothetical protein
MACCLRKINPLEDVATVLRLGNRDKVGLGDKVEFLANHGYLAI